MIMKTRFFCILIPFLVLGMVSSILAGSPDNINEDKGKVENITPTTLPPPTWNLYIHLTDDFSDTCAAAGSCSLGFLIQPATVECIGIPTDPPIKKPLTWGQANYIFPIPDDYPCVIVSIFVYSGTCSVPFNPNTCCECKENNQVCYLKVCPD